MIAQLVKMAQLKIKLKVMAKLQLDVFHLKNILQGRQNSYEFRLDSEAIMSNSGWCDDPESKNYNQFVKLPVGESAEKLFRSDDLYDLIFVLDYNINPIVKIKAVQFFYILLKMISLQQRDVLPLKK